VSALNVPVTRSKLKAMSIFAVISVVLADVCVVLWANRVGTLLPAWWQIAATVALQIITLLALIALLSRSVPTPQSFDSELSYRRQLPITLIGIVLVALALSFDLLFTAIACPADGIPSIRGRQICEIKISDAPQLYVG
jgi:membrane protease YdiL (CAAX protease family)